MQSANDNGRPDAVEGDGWITAWPSIRDWLAEEWRPSIVEGYTISNMGRVKNPQGRRLRPTRAPSGHLYVGLAGGLRKQVHQLVLLAFAGPKPSPSYESLHRNGIPWDNRAVNLRWGTRRENVHDLLRHTGKFTRSHLTMEQGEALRAAAGPAPIRHATRAALAERFGCSIHVVNEILYRGRYQRTG